MNAFGEYFLPLGYSDIIHVKYLSEGLFALLPRIREHSVIEWAMINVSGSHLVK